jgi:hypothetical protein
MSEQMIPITLVSGQNIVNITCDKIKISWPKPPSDSYYFAVVVDRKTLTAVACEVSDDLSSVPEGIKKYDGNTEYLLLIATYGLNNNSMPKGDLLTFLDKNGAGPSLAKLLQCATTLQPSYGYYSYCLASTMGTETGFENYLVNNTSALPSIIFLPLKLTKIEDQYCLVNIFPQ